ncbi:MAG TPA: Smr/MutS family protein [Candidatus Aquilonibacter sp.]|nr:Smr/MutS family protein [Candidatus Aquilonibacter sp.]
MSTPAAKLLEFDQLKEIVSGSTTCAPGRRLVEALAPRQHREALESEFALIREAMGWLEAGSDLGFASLADPEAWLSRLSVPGAVLEPAELLEAVSLMEAAAGVRQAFKAEGSKYPLIAARAEALADFRHISSPIRRAVMPNGEISDDASPQLKRIRAGMIDARNKVQRSLEGVLRARGETAGEGYVTLRNDRYVIPLRATDRRAVPGVVHGASATGQTIFLEPLESIELNNRLVQLREDETIEIARILDDLTARVRAGLVPLRAAAENIAYLDSLFARARFARGFDCTIPVFAQDDSLRLEKARNPVLDATLRRHGRSVVPLEIALGVEAGGTVMVISGPNTGGKTVALKTVGLAALSAQSAIPVAASEALLPVFDHVLADIGDEQSITADLSTFSAHMLNLKSMLEVATDRSLILVDEMGTGTAPDEGAALAVALLEEFRRRGALTIATTHHDRLKTYASSTPGIINGAMEFDAANLQPTYKLLTGVPGTSCGIDIARRLGIPPRVIEHAVAELSPEAREAGDLIAYLHRSRDELDQLKRGTRDEAARLAAERRALQTEWVERQKKRITELERNFLETQKRLEREVARLAEEIRDHNQRARIEKQSVRRMGKLATDARAETDAAVLETLAASQADLGIVTKEVSKPVEPGQLSAGQRVHVRGFKQPVIFRRLDGRLAEIEAGPMRMKVPVEDIVSVDESTANTGASRAISVHASPGEADEINVIGCTVEEASRRVDKLLDQAALAAKPSVRIIHGHGTGALRRGLAEFLSAHPLVDSIHSEAQDRGGTAITVAELKSWR